MSSKNTKGAATAKRATLTKDPREAAAGKKGSSQAAAPATTTTHLHDSALSATAEDKTARRKLSDADPKVTVRIPRAFNLQVLGESGSVMVRYEAGIDEMPASHANHDYSKAHGVEIVG